MQLQNKRYQFFITPEGLPQEFAFDPFLFLQNVHLKTQSEDELLVFQLLDQKPDKIVAHLPVFVNNNGLAYSPGRAPFGSVQFKNKLQEEVLFEFMGQVKRYLFEEKNCHTIRIKSYPFAYAPSESALLTELLVKQDFNLIQSEIGHFVKTDEVNLSEKMNRKTRWILVKNKRYGFEFREENGDFLEEAFTFIKFWQAEKGYSLSLKFEDLEKLFKIFSYQFRIFSVRFQNELVACSVAIKINTNILYNFYLASNSEFNQFSPAVTLIDGLYQICQKEEITILDLGTSNLPTGPNFPLIAFKKHLGGEPTLKLTFELKR